MRKINWQGWSSSKNILPSKEIICGFCGKSVVMHSGYHNINNSPPSYIYICPNCGRPTFFFEGDQHPGPLLGREISSLPDDIEYIYKEIRDDMKNTSYTSAVLLGRKLIMHLAVNIAEAQKGLSFVEYVKYLKDSHYLPPNGERILNFMKKLGNEQNHELKVGSKDQAEKIIKFVEVLLIHMYELPNEFPENDPETSSG